VKIPKGGARPDFCSQTNGYCTDGSSELPVGPTRPWKPSPLIRTSYAAHIAAVAAAVIEPELWPWSVTGIGVNHLVLTIAGLCPRSPLLGPNLSRLPVSAPADRMVAITLDDGPDPEVTPPILDVLDRYGITASFFCIGLRTARYPDIAREIVRRGHALENHSQHHHHRFPFLGSAGIGRELAEAQALLSRLSGRRPRFFRAIAGLRNPFLEPVLCRLDMQLVSWTRRGFDTLDRDPRRVAARLTKGLRAGDILVVHDGNSARTRSGVPVVLEVLPRVLDAVACIGLGAARLDALVPEE
jgi:peptidoglycan/xylan/chitin deacetylase (PgdA/CDA1 family)